MDSFYDSEEEVYAGCVSLKEKKRDITKKVVAPVKFRHTISCDPSFIQHKRERQENLMEPTKPDIKSAKPRRSSFPKSTESHRNFMEQLEEVLEVNNTSYYTAHDYEPGKERGSASKDESEMYESATSKLLLDDIRVTLYDSNMFPNESNISISDNDGNDDLIIISSDEDEGEENLHFNNFKQDGSTLHEKENLNCIQEILDTTSDSIQSQNSENNVSCNDTFDEVEKLLEDDTADDRVKENNEIVKEYQTYALTHAMNDLEVIEEVDEYSESVSKHNVLPRITLQEVSDEYNSENSMIFNDTLEEVERLMNGVGLKDYQTTTLSKFNHLSANLLQKNEEMHSVKTITPAKPPTSRLPLPESSKSKKEFKSPTAIIHTPRTLNRFKNIQSPVAAYIKNSGTAPLIQKVTPRMERNETNEIKRFVVNAKKTDQENSDPFELPTVMYKPAKQKLFSKREEFKLPKNIESFIPIRANVKTHELRIGGRKPIDSIPDGDLTVNSTFNATQDISVLASKNVFIP